MAENDEPEYMNLLGFVLILQGRLKEAEKILSNASKSNMGLTEYI